MNKTEQDKMVYEFYDFNGNVVEDCEEESLESLMVVEDEFGELMYL